MAKTIFEKHSQGRKGYTLPENDVDLSVSDCLPGKYLRREKLRLPEVSELDVMRHFFELSHMNHCIEKGFYPLGSCTMKYNPKLNETLVRNCGLMNIHPLQPEKSAQGALHIIYELQQMLAEIAGMHQVTLQPVAGAQGEFTGLRVMQQYHRAKGNEHKKVIIMPDSAHGTNPASVTLVGYETVQIKSDDKGMVDIDELKKVIDDNVAGFMLTNPNTLGIFEMQVEEIAELIHSVDGLLYMDGANLNALLGTVKAGDTGFDIIHFNLHKTFGTPHGGGGPGAGPVGVVEKLTPYLPYPLAEKTAACTESAINQGRGTAAETNEISGYYLDNSHIDASIGKVHSFYGNFAVCIRAYIYIKMLGAEGMKHISENAVINANYLLAKLKDYYEVPHHGNCMHEFVASGSIQKKNFGVRTMDIAKRLLDKGLHAPTVYFPLIVSEALMIEPTETESKETLDEFIKAMQEIAQECADNPDIVKSAPTNTPVRRVDDAKATRELDVKFDWEP